MLASDFKKSQNILDIYLEHGNTINFKIQCHIIVIVTKLAHILTKKYYFMVP